MNSELARIRDDQAKKLDSFTASLTTDAPQGKSNESTRDPNSLTARLSSPFYHDHNSNKSDTSSQQDSGRSHDSVNKEIMDLRTKLDARKKIEKMTPEVEKSKEELVTCLRKNDRRPLDCWKEVESFKTEVGKLEQAFIRKTSR